MTNVTDNPPFSKQLKAFSALGPYVRESLSNTDRVFFDCLATCLDIEKEAELREFWGWWLELTPSGSGYQYNYWYGLYDDEGNWQQQSIPDAHQEVVKDTLQRFFSRLKQLIEQEFQMSIAPTEALDNPEIASAA